MVPESARFCPWCGADAFEVDVIDLDGSPLPLDRPTRVRARRRRRVWSRRDAVVGVVVAALVVSGVVASRQSNDVSAPSTTSAAPLPTAAPSTTIRRALVAGQPIVGEPTGLEVWVDARVGDFSSARPSSVYRIDLDAATIQRVAASPFVDGPAPVSYVDAAGYHQIGKTSATITRAGVVSNAGDFEGRPIVTGADGVWREIVLDPRNTVLQRYGYDGELLDRALLPTAARVDQGLDDGRFVVRGIDGRSVIIDIAAGSMTPLIGLVRAVASRSAAYVADVCDDKLVCSTVYRSADGAVYPLALPVGSSSAIGITLSPDGNWVVTEGEPILVREGVTENHVIVRNPTANVLVDLGPLGAMRIPSTLSRWSPDGRWLFVPRRDGVAAWRADLVSPIVVPLGEGAMGVHTMAVGGAPGSSLA
jgi:hypothetical protein